MRHLLFLSVILAFLFGCETKDTSSAELAREENVSPTHLATFDIEGMMCQKGCGAAIRKGLLETGGVSDVEVAFSEENPVSQIKVYFDIKKTSTDKMINVIGGLADNRYSAKLKKVTQSTISYNRMIDDEESTNHKINGIPSREVSTKSFSFPNLTRLLNGLIN